MICVLTNEDNSILWLVEEWRRPSLRRLLRIRGEPPPSSGWRSTRTSMYALGSYVQVVWWSHSRLELRRVGNDLATKAIQQVDERALKVDIRRQNRESGLPWQGRMQPSRPKGAHEVGCILGVTHGHHDLQPAFVGQRADLIRYVWRDAWVMCRRTEANDESGTTGDTVSSGICRAWLKQEGLVVHVYNHDLSYIFWGRERAVGDPTA
eukprot:scaffold255313_cov28-Tisochrysis_lutea.AAC.4